MASLMTIRNHSSIFY